MSGTPSRCPRCGTTFTCGAGTGACWCVELPPLPLKGDRCFCPRCLAQVVREMEAERPPR